MNVLTLMRNLIPMTKGVLFVFFILTMTGLFSQTTPSSISGLKVWLAADTGLVQSGGTVQQWSDLSGNSNHFISPNASFDPAFILNSSYMGMPCLNFDGSDKLVSNNNFSITEATVFILSTQNASEPSLSRLIDHGYNTGFWFGRGFGNNIGGGFKEVVTPFGNFEPISDNQMSLLSIVRSGAVSTYSINGVSFTTPTRSTSSGATSSNKIVLGATITNDNFGKKNIYEVLIFDKVLNSVEMNQVNVYLGSKYANQVDLGADISNLNFCTTTLTGPSGFIDYIWSTGQTGPSISVNSSGDYWLEAKDALGFVTRDTIQVTYPILQTPTESGICQGSSVTWDTGLPNSNYTFIWSTAQTDSFISISSPGTYWVEVTDANNCTLSDTITFGIDNYATTASLGPDTSLCSGNLIGLVTGATNTVSYLWENNSTLATLPITISGTYAVEATNSNGCVVNDTIVVTVSGTAPTALFTASEDCAGNSVSFIDGSNGSAGDAVVSWNWDFDDGQTSTISNPSNIFQNPGVYAVHLDIQSAGGCNASLTQQIVVHANPAPFFNFNGFCTGDPTNFIDASINGDTTIASYSWEFGDPSLGTNNMSSLQNPSVDYQSGGTYPVKLTVLDNFGCSNDTTIPYLIYETATPSFIADDVCTGQTMNFMNTSTVNGAASYLWNFGDGTTSTAVDPSKNYIGYGTRNVTLQITTGINCVASYSENVEVNPFPNPDMQIGPRCIGTYVSLTDNSQVIIGTIDSVWWVINQTDTLEGSVVPFLVENGNQQQIEIIVKTGAGCQSSEVQYFTAVQPLEANFQFPTNILGVGVPLSFQNTSVGANDYAWNFGDGGTSVAASPTHQYAEQLIDSTIAVELIVNSNSGCADTIVKTVLLGQSRYDLEISNVFYQQNGNFGIVGVELRNMGTVMISSVQLEVRTKEGLILQEQWSGELQPGEKEIFVLSSQPSISIIEQDNEDAYLCVTGVIANNVSEETRIDNNHFCINVESDLPILMKVYPNPVVDELNLEVLLSETTTLTLELVDMRGRRVVSFLNSAELPAGYNTYQLSLNGIENGLYFVRMISNDEVTLQRVFVSH